MINELLKISVIMATYNGERFLEKQIESILNQNLKPAEILVCDDCSTDNTSAILKKYAEKGLLNYYINEQRLGVIANFKKAASLAQEGNFIAFSDQDDIWMPNKLQLSLKKLIEANAKDLSCVVYSDPIVIDSEGSFKANSLWNILGYDKYPHCFQTILFGNPAGGCTMLLNPELAKYIQTIPADTYMHDAWLTLCAYTFGKAFVLREQVVKYRQHGNNVTFSTNYVRRNKLKRVFGEIVAALTGKDALFKEQFLFIRQFYEFFYIQIDPKKRMLFERFLELEHKSYFTKKIAFRKAVVGVSQN